MYHLGSTDYIPPDSPFLYIYLIFYTYMTDAVIFTLRTRFSLKSKLKGKCSMDYEIQFLGGLCERGGGAYAGV